MVLGGGKKDTTCHLSSTLNIRSYYITYTIISLQYPMTYMNLSRAPACPVMYQLELRTWTEFIPWHSHRLPLWMWMTIKQWMDIPRHNGNQWEVTTVEIQLQATAQLIKPPNYQDGKESPKVIPTHSRSNTNQTTKQMERMNVETRWKQDGWQTWTRNKSNTHWPQTQVQHKQTKR